MILETLPQAFTVCKPVSAEGIDLTQPFCFAARTDEELSLVCPTELSPEQTTAREDGWRGFRISGVLEFSLIGILARISTLLAGAQIGIFAVSTFNTDYIFVKAEQFCSALAVLEQSGYTVAESR